jgi:hypothetical protein
MVQSQNYVAVLNFFSSTDKKAKEKMGIYYFKKNRNIIKFIQGEYGKILFDLNTENIIATDGH